ncbi:sugar transferase [Actinoplanes sp. NPDC049265]|uniref:sugar transferase n=1 Tax=Actinoplanes sp. NPDC049265 TaxID=3363902 RepID=UPI003712E36D
MYQFASVVRWGRATAGPAPALTECPSIPLPLPVVPVRAASAGLGEAILLLLLDGSAIAAIAYLTGVIAPAALILTLALAGLYRSRLTRSVLDDLPRIAVATAVVVAGGALLADPSGWAPRALVVVPPVWAAGLFASVVAARTLAYRLIRRHRRRRPGRAAIVVGGGDFAVRVADALREDRTYGIAPVGFVGPPALHQPTLPVLAPAADLERAVARYKPLHLIVAFPAIPDSDLVRTLRRCRRYGVTVHVVPRLFELAVGGGRTEFVRGIPLARLRPEPAQLRRWVLKRLIDVAGALAGLVLLAPVFLLCALAVKVESRRNGVLFRQERVGRDGKPFTILKFRSLTPADDRESQVKWNIDNDLRLGRVGRLLRFSSLDELPQLVNVLRGEMSLVGPRPERQFFVDQFQRTYAGYADRHRVPAGITGWAQIHGLRGDTSIEERVRFDNHYIEHWSLGLDIKIILRTVGSMLSIHRV